MTRYVRRENVLDITKFEPRPLRLATVMPFVKPFPQLILRLLLPSFCSTAFATKP
jgi:hypothetical protein